MYKERLDGFWCDRDSYDDHEADIWHWKSQCSNSISKVLVVIRVDNRYVGRK